MLIQFNMVNFCLKIGFTILVKGNTDIYKKDYNKKK